MTDFKNHIYMMPGLAANSKVFENINLQNKNYCIHKLDWIQPEINESLKQYCNRFSKKIKHKNPILLGVSFGGIIVQEIDKIIDVKKLIIVSSVKSHSEFPILFKIARDYGLNNVLPFGMFDNAINISMKLNINKLYKRIDLAERYLTERDDYYLEWAVKSLLNWRQDKYRHDLIHINGDKDKVFPISNISNCITIKGGRHEMIILKSKWFNKNLPRLIERT
ncbi:MAG: alpha/beta hydrolase [Flavobacteriaceae bacterium]|mgnify:FL=1|nr:alpha/beta hydrolase [Flavobacteriaceae bacterium]|tara:strand:+ start:66728 stop:67393 length:666 start_codon:yes stop_codon:yes gene_type:complete